MTISPKVKLTDLIAPSFYDVHHAIKQDKYTHYWLKGGRGSCKSTFASIEIPLGMMADKTGLSNAVVYRKVGNTLHRSVYNQLLWALNILGVAHLWNFTVSPMRMIYKETGQTIIFRGADDPEKSKGIKFAKGYARYVWYEEASEFHGAEEIRTINQTLLRGGDKFTVFYTYNPPKSVQNWINKEVTLGDRPDRLVHHSTYLTVPPEWIGEQAILEAEQLKKDNPQAYEHEYLGAVTGTGGEVFQNVTVREIAESEIASFDRIYRGLDFGFAADPTHYTVCHFDRRRKKLYIFDEIHRRGMKTSVMAMAIKAENTQNGIITADSAEPRTIAELKDYDLRVVGAKKGPGSVEHGIKFLSDLNEIIICKKRCPNTAREFLHYELERDKDGNFKAGYPDKNNHSIDAVRYALESILAANRHKFLK